MRLSTPLLAVIVFASTRVHADVLEDMFDDDAGDPDHESSQDVPMLASGMRASIDVGIATVAGDPESRHIEPSFVRTGRFGYESIRGNLALAGGVEGRFTQWSLVNAADSMWTLAHAYGQLGFHYCNATPPAQGAKPAPAPPPRAKPAAPACVGEGTLVYDPATKLVGACDFEGKHCAGVDPVTGAVRPLTARPKSAPSAVHLSAARDAICVGAGDASCTKLGKKATASLEKAFIEESLAINDGNPQPREPVARVVLSDDKAFAILGFDSYGGELWDLKKDKTVRVKAWTGDRHFRKQYASPVGFVGDLVVFSFAPCAGPCAESRLYTRGGKAVGKSFDGVGDLVTLSPGVAVGFGQGGGAVTISAKAKRATEWNEGTEDRVENGLVFQHAGALFMARAGTEGGKSVVEIFKLKADASGKEARVTTPFCSM